ncbi:MAG TPA: hypothetical protein DCE42_25220 [Myxococcales bacterium]|nr:hypothetical protein [Deltaproteobacteria bacterium]MBU52363.1 hypothetical protein [Deltaproteobacteria bacterium]HAA58088.1 hypothetical protein [Myxococcales bacterium]
MPKKRTRLPLTHTQSSACSSLPHITFVNTPCSCSLWARLSCTYHSSGHLDGPLSRLHPHLDAPNSSDSHSFKNQHVPNPHPKDEVPKRPKNKHTPRDAEKRRHAGEREDVPDEKEDAPDEREDALGEREDAPDENTERK